MYVEKKTFVKKNLSVSAASFFTPFVIKCFSWAMNDFPKWLNIGVSQESLKTSQDNYSYVWYRPI